MVNFREVSGSCIGGRKTGERKYLMFRKDLFFRPSVKKTEVSSRPRLKTVFENKDSYIFIQKVVE